MKLSIKMILGAGLAATMMSCSDKAAENADFTDIRIQKAFEHRFAKRTGTAGNHQRFSIK